MFYTYTANLSTKLNIYTLHVQHNNGWSLGMALLYIFLSLGPTKNDKNTTLLVECGSDPQGLGLGC